MFTFVLPDDSNNIQVSEEGTRMEKLSPFHARGENIAHLSDALGVGEELVLRVERTTERRGLSAPSFQLGFTMCDLTHPHKIQTHRQSCGRNTVCQKSFAQTVAQFASTGSVVTVRRTDKSIDIEVRKDREKRKYAMKFSTLPKEDAAYISPKRIYYPFVVLSGMAESVRILNHLLPVQMVDQPTYSNGHSYGSGGSPTTSESGIRETAERLIQSLVESPAKAVSRVRRPAPRPPCSWASLLQTDTPFTETTRITHYRFYPAAYAGNNLNVLKEGKGVKIKSQSGNRLAYISRPFTSDLILAFKVEKEIPSYLMCSHSFVVGFTTCDKDTVLMHPNHTAGFCNSSRPCAGTCGYHSIPSNAHAGSIVHIERKSECIKITITGKQSWRIETLRIPEAFVDVDVYPLIEMSGAAEEISIADVSSVPAPNVSKVTTSNPRFAMSMPRNEAHFSSAADHEDEDEDGKDEKIMFWRLPYAGNGIKISENNMKVWRTARFGARHVFFTREIEIGMSIVLKVTQGGGKLAPFRFEFGFTSCSKKAVKLGKVHMVDICSRSGCRGMSHTVGLKYIPDVVSTITITRKVDLFVIDAGKGVHHRRFFKHLPDGYTPDDRWFPLLTLTGDVDAVEIVDSWSRPVARRTSSPPLPCESDPVTQIETQSPRGGNGPSLPLPPVPQTLSKKSAKFDDSFERMPVSLPSSSRVIKRPPVTSITVDRNGGSSDFVALISSGDVRQQSDYSHRSVSPVSRVSPPSPHPQEIERSSYRRFSRRKWFSNPVVVFHDPLISRMDESPDAKSYIFSAKLMPCEKIGFRMIQTSIQKAKVVFGVTTVPLLTVDVSELPGDAAQLTTWSDWFVYPHLATCVGVSDGLIVTRTHSGISLMLPHDPDSEHQIISGIHASATVFPFFQFSNCDIEILHEQSQNKYTY